MKSFINTDTLLGAISAVIGVLLLISSMSQSATAFVLPGDAPPFLVPQIFLYLWITIALALLLNGILKGGVEVGNQNWLAIATVLAIVIIAALMMKLVGYLIVAPIAVFLVCLTLGYKDHRINAVVSIVFAGLLYGLLTGLAKMPLPPIPGLEF